MLRQLSIQNFAIIEHVELSFESGFSVITGETGSGKSMLLDALHLILGERADFNIIGPLANKAIVEGKFKSNADIRAWLSLHEIDEDDELIVRREITKEGKSRAFINDTPVTLNLQRELAIKLVHIHSQFNTIELKDKRFQLELFDHLAETTVLALSFQKKFSSFQHEKNKLNSLKDSLHEAEKSIDYTLYLKEELSKLNLSSINYQDLEKELRRSENQSGLNECYAGIAAIEEEGGVLDILKRLSSSTDKWSTVDEGLKELGDRISSVRLELKDISSIANDSISESELSVSAVNELTQKIDEYNRLLNKHKCKDQEELVHCYHELSIETLNIEQLKEQIVKLEQVVFSQEQLLMELAKNLHDARQKQSEKVIKELDVLLGELNLPNTELQIDLKEKEEFDKSGITKMEWLFSANVGYAPVSIEKAASGGELSRLMLALQKMLSEKKELPTILFDEIDTGVSGEVAEKMGKFIKVMGKQRQIFAISHLPQVAAKANAHFFVKKNIEDNRAITQIVELTENERIEEIARLMSGEKITDSARLTAKALIND
ncbi:MAG: DNA repair protein RecN [Crocinitomicaceae bacterium]